MIGKKNIAVLFGGTSQEHDVSVVSAQQLMDAIDVRTNEVFPVYLDFENRLQVGPTLRQICTFDPSPPRTTEVMFSWGEDGPALISQNSGARTPIDCVIPVFHGPFGEDGRVQGHFELLGIPVAGFSAGNSAIAMRKDATKALVSAAGVNVLKHITVGQVQLQDPDALGALIEENLGYPVVVKPANLGSSIGVGIAEDVETAILLLQNVLTLDNLALVEPKVPNLREFNISIIWKDNEIKYSAIESPKSGTDLLDFREKYLSNDGGGKKGGFQPSEGMLSLTRDINPDISISLKEEIYSYASKAFMALGLRGAPRIDFMVDQETEELWFNEINPIPGSYGFFLWEAASEPMLYPELIDHLVDEALSSSVKGFVDPVPAGAYLLARK